MVGGADIVKLEHLLKYTKQRQRLILHHCNWVKYER